MLLAVDVGNSETVLGVFDDSQLTYHWRVSTHAGRTPDELALLFSGLLGFRGLSFPRHIDGVVIASVVPSLTETLRDMVRYYCRFEPIIVEPGTRTGIAIRMDNPREVGADRIVNAVAAHAFYGGPAIVVDFGTATSFDAVGRGGEFLGGAIAPGIQSSTDALVARAARLPKVEIVAPKGVIGTSTVTALQSGIVFGFAGQVDSIVTRMRESLGRGVTTIATGGLAFAVLQACSTIDHHDPWLTLKGLRIIWERNTGE